MPYVLDVPPYPPPPTILLADHAEAAVSDNRGDAKEEEDDDDNEARKGEMDTSDGQAPPRRRASPTAQPDSSSQAKIGELHARVGYVSYVPFLGRVLFDSGASYSFITSAFIRALGLEVNHLDRPLCVDTPVEGSVTLGRVYQGCSIMIIRRVLEFKLILLKMTGFDIILGMDWLSSFRAVIDCFRGRVSVCTPNGDCFCFMGD
ncbi:uncharacterized protein LOC132277416 [Cornus florida]|uniref:uncharacterized protein LOC132277416 n=1 Tax=Cornus florida TaxID=4283 RepID=UPI0028A160BD|nr:uncharacterized protein LOC132277416 [Cornus florida]